MAWNKQKGNQLSPIGSNLMSSSLLWPVAIQCPVAIQWGHATEPHNLRVLLSSLQGNSTFPLSLFFDFLSFLILFPPFCVGEHSLLLPFFCYFFAFHLVDIFGVLFFCNKGLKHIDRHLEVISISAFSYVSLLHFLLLNFLLFYFGDPPVFRSHWDKFRGSSKESLTQ